MDITEKRLPQDGRAKLADGERRIHLRLSSLPTVHGESLVLRLLDQTMPIKTFAELGFAPGQAEALAQVVPRQIEKVAEGRNTQLEQIVALSRIDRESRERYAARPRLLLLGCAKDEHAFARR